MKNLRPVFLEKSTYRIEKYGLTAERFKNDLWRLYHEPSKTYFRADFTWKPSGEFRPRVYLFRGRQALGEFVTAHPDLFSDDKIPK